MPSPTPQSEALIQAREHGLWGRADSPPDWQLALEGSIPGEPILVKDPTDPRDDFFLVPMRPTDPTAQRSAWIMLDAASLELREAALLDHWKFPAFPEEGDIQRIAQTTLLLPDGTNTSFPPSVLRPNRKNLVWRASDASILPYWPLKEWTAPHPVTGEPVSIYVTQEGEILTSLTSERILEPQSSPTPSAMVSALRLGFVLLVGVLIGWALHAVRQDKPLATNPPQDELGNHLQSDNERLSKLLEAAKTDVEHGENQSHRLTLRLANAEAKAERDEQQIKSLSDRLKESEKNSAQAANQTLILLARVAELERRKSSSNESDPIKIPKANPAPSPASPLTDRPGEPQKP